jgi:uncharacterized protein YidB (DUF937 family)
MGLFDSIIGAVEGQAAQHLGLAPEAGNLINQAGGVNGLVQQAQQQGIGGIVSSWIGGGANQPISADQIINLIGQDRLTAIAAKVGLPEPAVATGLTMVLPLLINQLTPNGTVPPHSPDAVNAAASAVASTPPPASDSAPATS